MVTLREIEEREKELQATREQAIKISKQKIPERKFGAGVTPELQKQYIQRRREAQQVIKQVEAQREQLQPIKRQVLIYEGQVKAAQQRAADYERGFNLAFSDNPAAVFAVPQTKEGLEGYQAGRRSAKPSEEYQKQVQQYKEQGLKPIYSSGKLVGFQDSVTQQSYPIQSIPTLPTSELSRYEKAGVVTITQTQQAQLNLNQNQVPISTITAVQQDKSFSNLYGLPDYINRKSNILTTKQSRGQGGFTTQAALTGIGFAKPFVETARAAINPIETTKSIVNALKTPKQTIINIKKEVSTTARVNPAGFVGEFLGNIAVLKTPIVINKGVDVLRVKGLTKIDVADVVAPEYFRGQNYPKIAKGQTAGELLTEFKQPSQYGVTRLTGFTAAPKPFKKLTTALPGSSELPGVYQAPKISPNFLRISSESNKIIGTKIFDTLRPSAMRINPKEFNLIPGVNRGQSRLASLKEARSFYKTGAKTGRSYVPFVKTEKEAIIPAGTQLERVNKRFFFEFEGRKVPISEFEILEESLDISKEINKLPKINDKIIKETFEPLQNKNIIVHYTKAENIEKIIKEGFKTNRKPLIPVDEAGRKLGQADKVLYFTKNKGGNLSPLYAEIKPFAKLKKITTEKGFKELVEIGKRTRGDLVYPTDYAIRGAKIKGYDILQIKYNKNFVALSKNKFIRTLQKPFRETISLTKFQDLTTTTGFGTDDFFILNKESIRLIGGEEKIKTINLRDNFKGISLNKAFSSSYRPLESSAPINPFSSSVVFSKFKSDVLKLPKESFSSSSYSPSSVSVKVSAVRLPSYSSSSVRNPYSSLSVPSSRVSLPSSSLRVPSSSIKPPSSRITPGSSAPKLPRSSITPRITGGSSFRPPKTPPIRPGRLPPPKLSSAKPTKSNAVSRAFRPYVIKKGKEVFLPTKPLSRGQALRVAESEARRSLRATFGVKEVKGIAIGKDINFTPSSKLFRSYRIKSGKKIPLTNTFIQRKGKRLISGGEISEIQKARRFKL